MRETLCTLARAAEQIGCDRSTVYRQAQTLGLGVQVGRTTLLTPGEVKKLAKVITPRPQARKNRKKGRNDER